MGTPIRVEIMGTPISIKKDHMTLVRTTTDMANQKNGQHGQSRTFQHIRIDQQMCPDLHRQLIMNSKVLP